MFLFILWSINNAVRSALLCFLFSFYFVICSNYSHLISSVTLFSIYHLFCTFFFIKLTLSLNKSSNSSILHSFCSIFPVLTYQIIFLNSPKFPVVSRFLNLSTYFMFSFLHYADSLRFAFFVYLIM